MHAPLHRPPRARPPLCRSPSAPHGRSRSIAENVGCSCIRCAPRLASSSAKAPRPLPSTTADARAQFCFGQNKFRRALGPRANSWLGFASAVVSGCAHFRKIPTIEADIKFAIVPASIARMPSFASSRISIRRERADAADLHSDRTEIRKAAQRKRRDGKRARIERALHRSEKRKRHEFVEHHARAQQVADRACNRATARRSTNATGAKTQPKICCKLDGNH